jgi:hypothetical protein
VAKRRALHRALSGLGEGLGNASSYLFRQSQIDRQQDRLDDRAAAGQKAIDERAAEAATRTAVLGILGKLAEDGLDPSQAAAQLALLTKQEIDPASLEGMRPPTRRRLGKRFDDDISKATSPEAVPSDEDVLSFARGDAGLKIPGALDEMSGDPFGTFRPEVREMSERAAARRRSLREQPTETVNVTTDTGAQETRFVSPYAGPVQTEPSSQRQGELAGTKSAAEQKTVLGDDALIALKGQTEARIQNIVENLTRAAKVTTAAATAGAEKRATLAPDIITSEVDRSNRLASGKEHSTEGERRAATNFAPLINAHAKAALLEQNGARIGTGEQTATTYGVTNWAVPAQTQEYIQSARDFISTIGLIRSGVAVPEAEKETFMSSMFGTKGDDPRTLKNKQATREVFIASLQAMVGRSGDDAGRLLAGAINGGQIPKTVLLSLKFDPAIEKALLAHVKVPRFDSAGRPISVDSSGLRPQR